MITENKTIRINDISITFLGMKSCFKFEGKTKSLLIHFYIGLQFFSSVCNF